jgi:hypothetical protein
MLNTSALVPVPNCVWDFDKPRLFAEWLDAQEERAALFDKSGEEELALASEWKGDTETIPSTHAIGYAGTRREQSPQIFHVLTRRLRASFCSEVPVGSSRDPRK